MLADARAHGFDELSIRPWASGSISMWASEALDIAERTGAAIIEADVDLRLGSA